MAYSQQVANQQTSLNQQYNAGLRVDGILGPITQAAINRYTPQTLTQGQSFQGGIVNYDTQTGQRLNSGATTALPQAIPPSNAGAIVQGQNPIIPQTNPTIGNVSSAVSSVEGTKTNLEILGKQAQDTANAKKAELDARRADAEKSQGLIASLMSSSKSTAENRADSYADIGIDPKTYFAEEKAKITEIGSLTGEYNALKTQMQAEKDALIGQGRGIPMGVLNAQDSAIERKYAPQLNRLSAEVNSKAALLQALQGNFNEAKNFVNQAVEDATADTKFKFDTLKTFYDMNQNTISTLSSEYKDALDNSLSIAEKTYNQDVINKKTASDAMMKYNSLGAGISIYDTPDEVAQKVSSVGGELAYYGQQQRIQNKYSASGAGSSPVTGVNEDIVAYGSQYADTGKLPSPAELKLSGLSVGQVTSYAKQIPRPDGSLVSTNTGVKPTTLSPVQEDGIAAARDAEKKLQRLKELYNSPYISVPLSKTRKEFNVIKDEFVDLLARARTGAVINDEEAVRYEAKIPSINISIKSLGNVSFDTLSKTLSSKLDTTLKTQGVSVYGYSKVKVGGVDRTVGEVIDIGGAKYRVLPDGTLTDII